MVIASKLIAAGIIAASFLVGCLSFYIMSNLPIKMKKKHIAEIVSQLINFVLFMWAGKIILNLSSFLSDPLTILAYPANSMAFYFAVFASIIMLIYKDKQKKLDLCPFMESFVHVFLVASFLYEFLEIILKDNVYAFGYLLLLSVLIILYFFLRERIQIKLLLLIILGSWSLGIITLSFMQPFVTVFGYMMDPWFISIFFIIVLALSNLFYKTKRGFKQ
ncbi:hypothetical protein J18TS1_07470 [Oceanobacillus oncorhynchi subsp. incaldanensis]|uniref:Uncharacterized protein n=2 Tax=Oceanobacillus TaxID=182709 RepID=A0A0A1MCE2_9BACI|nr:hypothetical protein [Oceanobacillus oncorhynchi]MDM8102256.1 hypothetical protein [Oceanobacillus oncorhynchi]UUI41519.1 hypothetical protein NP440_08260 [Oceanobacillus oncorhynchi]GIO17647.1 hypothetical protein J18TS1_07470 [Oceanobacillus oncorhynchi subsp. incaldanensis]CEI83030.1 hypothetical protein BN997_02919 [Oceanobacillus oncorhynchi]